MLGQKITYQIFNKISQTNFKEHLFFKRKVINTVLYCILVIMNTNHLVEVFGAHEISDYNFIIYMVSWFPAFIVCYTVTTRFFYSNILYILFAGSCVFFYDKILNYFYLKLLLFESDALIRDLLLANLAQNVLMVVLIILLIQHPFKYINYLVYGRSYLDFDFESTLLESSETQDSDVKQLQLETMNEIQLQVELKNALLDENYELAEKIKEVLEKYK